MAKKQAVPEVAQMKVTLVRSLIGRPKDQAATVQTLGLRKINQSVIINDSDSARGLVNKVRHLVTVEELSAQA